MKTAVVLFNLGGPDSLSAVKPFLFNLFSDPAIIQLPQPLRYIVAKLISWRRAGKARAIYQQMGGKSPILDLTSAQADALEQLLKKKGEYKTFVCMRYWNPMSETVVKNVNAYQPDRIILLPLYPQFSTTTTGSSLADWELAAKKAGLTAPTTSICCYPTERSLIAAHVKLIKDVYWKAAEHGQPRLLFSAHGLPEKIIKAGDPYQSQVEKTVAAIVQILCIDGLDYSVCYQSRVGPMQWIKPSTEEEIERAAKDQVPVVIVPVAFVSEHSETLVELDIEYRKLAESHNIPGYYRVPALGTEPYFIEGLADLCLANTEKQKSFCSPDYTKCPCLSANAVSEDLAHAA